MTDILFIYEREIPTVSGTRDCFEELERRKIVSVSFQMLTKVKRTDINSHHVIVFIRPENILASVIAKKAKKAGHPVFVLCDDDLLNRQPGIPWRIRELKKILFYADVIWSSSQYICNKYKKYIRSGRTAVTDTVVRKEQILDRQNRCREDDLEYPVRIVYAAAAGHYIFFDRYIRPVIPALIKRYGRKISFTFVGVRPDMSSFESDIRIRYVKGMPLQDYRAFMQKNRFDIGIAPLTETSFTKCKYFNKYIEYSMMGIMGVYSDVIPYSGKIRNMENGILAENHADGWYRALCTAIDSRKLRMSCVKKAQEDLRKNHAQGRIVRKMFEDLPEIKQKRIVVKKCSSFFYGKCLYYLCRPLDWMYLSLYYLKEGGIRGFTDRLVLHMRNRHA